MPDFHCTKLCPSLLEFGVCSNPACAFAHDSGEIRRRHPGDLIMPRVAKESVPPPPFPPRDAPLRARASPQGFEAMLVKTKMCKFHLIGECTKGSACTFAHSPEELQPVPDLTCTKLCPSVLNTGYCNVASCGFAHAVSEIQGMLAPPTPCKQRLTEEALCAVASTKASSRGSLALSSECGESTNASGYVMQSEGTQSDSWSISSQAGDGPCTPTSEASSLGARALFFKTKMCKYFAKGACSRGEACNFAHSASELRQAPERESSAFVALPSLPADEGSRVLLAGSSSRQYFLAVKNGFFTVDTEESPECTRRRAHSLPARRQG